MDAGLTASTGAWEIGVCQGTCHMRQSDLDKEMVEEGRRRHNEAVASLQRRGKESWTSYGQRLISGAVAPVADMLEHYRATKLGKPGRHASALQPLGDIDAPSAALIAMQVAMDCITTRQRASRCFCAIGDAIEYEIRMRALRKDAPSVYAAVRKMMIERPQFYTRAATIQNVAKARGMDRYLVRVWDDVTRLRVGALMVSIIRDTTGLIDLETVRERATSTQTYVVPTPECEAFIKRVLARTEILDPVKLPMVVPPYPWTSAYKGGYHVEEVGDDLIKGGEDEACSLATPEAMPEVYKAVNYLQSIPFRINKEVYEVFQWAWEKGLEIGSLPSSIDIEVPPKPTKDLYPDPEVYRRRWIDHNHLREAQSIQRSQRVHVARLKRLAEKFCDANLFFPVSLDFRGRLYTQPAYLTYQGCDPAKGMLEFGWEGKPLGEVGKRWLRVHGANSFGVKGSIFDRVQWCNEHAAKILQCGQNPTENQWWTEADEPWQFLAFCIEVRRIVEDPAYPSRLICWQDGTNNGLQVLSLAWRDEVGGAATNCTPSEDPRDVYQDVADDVIEMLHEDIETGDEMTVEWAKRWLSFGIDRSTTKRLVMIVPYSGTLFAGVKYVRSWYDGEVAGGKPRPWPDATRQIGYLAKKVWEAIGRSVLKGRDAMHWLRKVGDACYRRQIHPRWFSPLGFPCIQQYWSYRSSQVQTVTLRKTHCWQLREKTKKIAKSKSLNGIAPNWVHSLDAAAMFASVNRCSDAGLKNLATVHDCYGCLAEDGDVVAKELRIAWSEMFSKRDVVADLRKEIEGLIGEPLPDPPEFGTLDTRSLVDSRYFFS